MHYRHPPFAGLAIAALLAATGVPARADTSKIALPENYASTYVRYASIDKPAGKRPAKMRFFYVSPSILAAAKAGEPLPDGTLLIMEDHEIALDDQGKPKTDAQGRFIPTDVVTNIFVQEKRKGWGSEYAEAKRNGEWEYAWFLPDGSHKADAKLDGCFECHKGVADADYNFTFSTFVNDIKTP